MTNFNLKKYLANNPLLNEIKVNKPVGVRIIKDPKIVDWLSELFEFNASGFNLNFPLENEFNYEDNCEIYPDRGKYEWDTWDDFNNTNICKVFKYFSEKPKGIYLLSPNSSYPLPALGAPNNSFYEKITVEGDFGNADYDKDSMENLWIGVETPWISAGPGRDGPYGNHDNYHYAGWFDARGKYHADDKNFDEDGNYIGNSQ